MLCILIVDDEPLTSESLKSILEAEDHEVDTAPTAAEAVRACTHKNYGVIFLDLGLPDRSGLELLPDLQRLCPESEVIVLTANTSLDTAAQAVNQGANFYIRKPIDDVPTVLHMVQRIEEDLRRREQLDFQRLVLQNVQESVIAIGLDGRVSYWNHGAEALYGWSAEEMMGQPVSRIVPEYDDITWHVTKDGITAGQETVRRRHDGSLVDIEERVHPLRDPTGAIIGHLALSRDITDRKESERKLAEVREREHRIAVTFQRALLPAVDSERPGLQIGWLYEPAWAEADVGGDFYDIMPLPHDRTAMVLGDVSGKGLSAGVLMSIIRNVINAYAFEDDGPHEVLTRTNRHLLESAKIPEERFVTLFYATFNPAKRHLAYSSAGHEPAILVQKDGSVLLLGPTGPMVGLDSGMEFECTETPFEPGDLLVIYTDGATEAGGPGNFLGTEGLVDLVSSLSHLPPQEVIHELHAAIVERSGGFAQDDLAILCLRCTPWPAGIGEADRHPGSRGAEAAVMSRKP